MASVKYVNGTSKPVKSSSWNVERINGSTVFKIESGSQKAKISFAGNTWEINKYYLSLPKSLSLKEINYIINSISPQDLIVNASLCVDYGSQIEALKDECSKITLTNLREKIWSDGNTNILKKFTREDIETIINTNSIISPYMWQLTPIFNSIELNGANITVNKGERVFVLQVL